MTMLSPDASGLMAQMRALTDLTQALLAVTDQLLGDVWMAGEHGIFSLLSVGNEWDVSRMNRDARERTRWF